MEEHEFALREALAMEVLPETIRDTMADFKAYALLEIDRERNRDGDVTAMIDRALSLYNEVCARVGIPQECILCPTAEQLTRYPPRTHNGYMELRCGHRVHTQCYLNVMMRHDIHSVMDTRCYICEQSVMEPQAITFFQDLEQDNRMASVVDLWTNNPEFREDLKVIIKERAACIKRSIAYGKEAKELIKEYKEVVNIPLQTLKLYRKTYTTRLSSIPSRRKMIYHNSKYIKRLNEFCRKYKTWTSRFRALRGMAGVPRLPASLNIPWKYRTSAMMILRSVSRVRM
jgi:hypothetical protein